MHLLKNTGLILTAILCPLLTRAEPQNHQSVKSSKIKIDKRPVIPKLRAGRLTSPLDLDGLLNEPEWDKADSISTLTEVDPNEGSRPSARTVVRILANSNYIAIGIEAYDNKPSKVIGFSRGRDAFLQNQDNVKIVLGTFHDRRTGYVFATNPEGARYDALINPEGGHRNRENRDWNTIWEAKATRTDFGWSAEILIPTKSLMFKKNSTVWGFNVERQIKRLQEVDRWSGANHNYHIDQMNVAGDLTNLPKMTLGHGISITPAVTFGGGKPASGASETTTFKPSIDISKRIGSNLNSTLTFNTDFAQTQVDARQTNLTRFPLFYPEKRAFFLQGADIFNFGVGLGHDVIPFFSRTIGLVDGVQVPIMAGGKISGRIGQTNVGGLVVHTARKDTNNALLVPATTMSAIRVQQNIFSESNFGIIATAGDPTGLKNAWMLGGDLTLKTSHFEGDKNIRLGIWGLANNKEGLTGDKTAEGIQLSYPNDLWNIALTYKRIGDGFQPSLGFVPRPGIIIYDANLIFAPRPSWSWLRQVFFMNFPRLITDLHGHWESYRYMASPLNLNFESGDRIEFDIIPQGERLFDPFDIASNVTIPDGKYNFLRYQVQVNLASKRKLHGHLSYQFGTFYDGKLHQIQAHLFWNPNALFNMSLTAERDIGLMPEGDFTKNLIGTQFGFNFSTDLGINSFIQYDTDSKVLGTNTRLAWTFNPYGKVFVVYNHSLENMMNRFEFQQNELLIKIEYTFRY